MKKLKKLLCAVMAAVTMLSLSVPTSAENVIDDGVLLTEPIIAAEPDDEGYVLVSEEKSMVGEYCVVDRTYILPSISAQANDEGSDTIKRSRSIYVGGSDFGDLIAVMWVEGYFTWSASKDRATISNPKGWTEKYNNGYKVYDKKGYPKHDSDCGATVLGGVFGNKYAYIEYIIKVENMVGVPTEFRLWLDVNVKGEIKVRK